MSLRQVIVVTQARVHCLICTQDVRGWVWTYQALNAQVPVLQLICYTSDTLKICPNLLLIALAIYITKDSHCDYGILILTFPWHLFIQYIPTSLDLFSLLNVNEQMFHKFYRCAYNDRYINGEFNKHSNITRFCIVPV